MKTAQRINKLKRSIILFVLVLFVPAIILFTKSLNQIKHETVYKSTQLAQDLTKRINSDLTNWITVEERRAYIDYQFLVASGEPSQNYFQQSPLANFPVESSIPGLIGYFQVDGSGAFSTPILPDNNQGSDYGVSADEYAKRSELANTIYALLSDNKLVSKTKDQNQISDQIKSGIRESNAPQSESYLSSSSLARAEPGAVMFDADVMAESEDRIIAAARVYKEERQKIREEDNLEEFKVLKQRSQQRAAVNASELGLVADLQLEKNVELDKFVNSKSQKSSVKKINRSVIKVKSLHPNKVVLFESDIEPFEFSILDSGHFILYRQVLHDGQRFFQGALIEQSLFIESLILDLYRESSVSEVGNLIVGFQNEVLKAINAGNANRYASSQSELTGTLLLEANLLSPLDDFSLLFTIGHISFGQQASTILVTAGMFALILLMGAFVFYRVGVKEIKVWDQQQDFVSSVSHELKTPLTSIRMYGEILLSGMLDGNEVKQREYYQVIFDESERLSRLIINVLQLANMNQGKLDVDLSEVTVGELVDMIRSRVLSNCQRSGFELLLPTQSPTYLKRVNVDKDAFLQVVINLIDNAIKFGKNCPKKTIIIDIDESKDKLTFTIRDHGPGISNNNIKHIFDLFYRGENEMTRQTTGTGIGLSLVKQLVTSMGGDVIVKNVEPGVQFAISFNTAIEQ
jgi:signal transduction histidine kinase